jgi:hypothetical protein
MYKTTLLAKDSIYSLALESGDILRLESGLYQGKLVRFLGYWHPGCRVEILETSEIVDLFADRASLVQHGVNTVTKNQINLTLTVEIAENNILDVMYAYKCNREEAIKHLTKAQLVVAIDNLLNQTNAQVPV